MPAAVALRAPSPGAVRKPRRASERMRAYRARLDAGVACYSVPVDGEVLDALVRWGWLREDAASDKLAVGRAIGAMVADAVRHR